MIPEVPGHVATITDAPALRAFAARLARRAWIAVDTEFLRQRTYYPKLCLVQIADCEEIGLIDVLAIDDLAPLAAILADTGVRKVFHSAEQDLEVLFQRFGRVPAPLFDTQLAAPLAGFDEQIGYAPLIKAVLDIDLAKSHTRTNWCRRPLSAGALAYAADDVRYLAPAYLRLRDQLIASGRLAWLDSDCERLTDPARFRIDPCTAWRRLRGWHRLAPNEQQILAELAAWREREAIAADRPRRWIIGDDVIMAIARRQPADQKALRAIAALPDKTADRHGQALLACVRRGLTRPAIVLAKRPSPPDAQTKKQITAGLRRLHERAQALKISPGTLASRQEIAAIVAGARDTRLLHGWRAEAAGAAVVAAIEAAQMMDRKPPA